MSQSKSPSNVVAFRSRAELTIVEKTKACPALAAIGTRLPHPEHEKRQACMRALATLFQWLPAYPKCDLAQARKHLQGVDPQEVVAHEIPLFRDNPKTQSLFLLMATELWYGEDDPYVQEQAKLYLALYLRLYRRARNAYLKARQEQAQRAPTSTSLRAV